MTVAQPNAKLFLSRGRALVIGPGIDSRLHTHFAAQLTLALERPFRARLGADLAWEQTSAALFAPNQLHQIDCGGDLLAHLFLELPPRTLQRSMLQAEGLNGTTFDGLREALRSAHRELTDALAADALMHCLSVCVVPQRDPGNAPDHRIALVLAWLAEHPEEQRSGAQLAALVHLSSSRFTHLFRQQTGLSLSRFLLWNRLLRSVDAAARGASMTDAAHAAGFADLAHMSRTFRQTFGVVASELQKMTIAFKP